MNILSKYDNYIDKLSKVRTILLYGTLSIELLLMLYEKTDMPLSTPSYIFRITFALSLVVIAMTKYSKKQWIAIALVFGFTFFCYKWTGNNDLIRFSAFVIACKDEDTDKIMKYILAITGFGFLFIALASIFGIFGNLALVMDYGRIRGQEARYVFGFGHPNTLHGSIFLLVVLFCYVYESSYMAAIGHDASKERGILKAFNDVIRNKVATIVIYAVIFLLNYLVFHFTDSRTGFLMVTACIAVALILHFCKMLRDSKVVYILGGIAISLCIGISVWASVIAEKTKAKGSIYKKIDRALTGRIYSLYYDTRAHKGTFETWTLFGDSNSGKSYFDMGWVRVFYWYGVIPACLIILLLAIMYYRVYKRRDYASFIMMLTVAAYTVIEANFISSYIGRNFMLPLISAYIWGRYGEIYMEDRFAGKE